MQPVFTIKDALSFGWKKTVENLAFFVLLTLGFLIVSAILNKLSGDKNSFSLFNLVSIAVSYFAMYTFVRFGLKVYKGEKPQVKDILDVNWGAFGFYVIGAVISTVLISVGFILFIIPGIYLSVRLGFFAFAMIDENLTPIDGLKRSLDLTKEYFWILLGFSLVLALVTMVGVMLLGVGLLVTAPLCLIATAYVYEKLKSASSVVPKKASETPAIQA